MSTNKKHKKHKKHKKTFKNQKQKSAFYITKYNTFLKVQLTKAIPIIENGLSSCSSLHASVQSCGVEIIVSIGTVKRVKSLAAEADRHAVHPKKIARNINFAHNIAQLPHFHVPFCLSHILVYLFYFCPSFCPISDKIIINEQSYG